ncbi:3'(2'),5'-bisphosphate nucleotidase [Myxococcota bacterium]|nr:3'(2'),5'-bisphosphate nucleotidase [Myxococcota bacterium]
MSERELDLSTAMNAVRAAARVCRDVQHRLVKSDTLEKKDRSPVTVADFASQAIVCSILETTFPEDEVVGEEDSASLAEDDQGELRRAVVQRVAAQTGSDTDEQKVMDWIDRGGADASSQRYWTLDPIDGTKGFLRGDQYAVALGLIEDGEVVLGALACPNLSTDGEPGALLTGVAGGGARAYALWDDSDVVGREIQVAQIERASQARFCESVEAQHSDQDTSAQIAETLGIRSDPYRIDSQCKYAAVARNDASIYLRLPTLAHYQEKIWDHAAGKIVVESAGGRVTDATGVPLDFSRGRLLDANEGVVATCGGIHDEVIAAVQRARGIA